jgi:hypothetical protein
VIAICRNRHDIRLSAFVSVLSSGLRDRKSVKYNLIAIAMIALAGGAGLGAGGAYMVLSHAPAAPLAPTLPPAPVAAEEPAPALVLPAPAAAEPAPSAMPAQNIDAQRALDGVRKQEFLPLQTISAAVRERFPGEVISAKLDEDDGVMKYELKILTANGRVLEVDVDPRSGKIIDIDEDD